MGRKNPSIANVYTFRCSYALKYFIFIQKRKLKRLFRNGRVGTKPEDDLWALSTWLTFKPSVTSENFCCFIIETWGYMHF